MTPTPIAPDWTKTPWQIYLAAERAARDMYLLVTARAHAEYLTGSWPDRDAYLMVEREAYATYYQAGRHAWNAYRDAMDAITTAPARAAGYEPNFPPAYRTGVSRETPLPARPDNTYPYRDYHSPDPKPAHGQATFTAYPEGDTCGYSPFSNAELMTSGTRCSLRINHPGDHNDQPPRTLTHDLESEQ